MTSQKPGKQRKALYQAPLHRRHKLLAAHLSKELRKQFKRRSLPLRTGDEVKIMRGAYAGKTAKISEVDLKKIRVYTEEIKRKRVSGQEVKIPLHPSNLMITNPVLEDAMRKRAIERGMKK